MNDAFPAPLKSIAKSLMIQLIVKSHAVYAPGNKRPITYCQTLPQS